MFHVQSAECPFNWIDMAVTIAIEFKKVIARDIRHLGNRHPRRTAIQTRVIPLRSFQQAIEHQLPLRRLGHECRLRCFVHVGTPESLTAAR